MSVLLIIMYNININYVQYFSFKTREIIKCFMRKEKMQLASRTFRLQ